MSFTSSLCMLCKSYITWIVLHYLCMHLYTKICLPFTFSGFILSPFFTISPQCKALYWLQDFSRNNINNMWGVFALWIMAKCKKNFS